MPSLTTALIYNGTCLFEATNISEGRGTTRPYEVIGAPFVSHESLAEALNAQNLPGVRFRACCFTPTFDKYQGELCYGVQIHITDHNLCNGFATGLTLFETMRQLEAEMEITNPRHLNHLFGDCTLLDKSECLSQLLQRAEHESSTFVENELPPDTLYPLA